MKQKGFTLLEVMIALTIMTVALSAILTSQSGSIFQTMKSRDLNIAGWIAQRMMVEAEHLFEGKPVAEMPKDPEIKKCPEPFERFTCKRVIKEIHFPDLTPPQKEGSGIPEPLRILGQSLTKYMNNSVRELVVTISWDRGEKTQEISVSTFLVDMNAEFTIGI